MVFSIHEKSICRRRRFTASGFKEWSLNIICHYVVSSSRVSGFPSFHLVFKNLAIDEQFWSMLSVFGFQWGQYNHYWNCYYQRLLLSILSSKWWYYVAFVISQVTSYEKFSCLIYISHTRSWCKEVRADPSFYPP